MNRWLTNIFFLMIIGLSLFYFWPETKLDSTKPIDKIVVLKSERELKVYSNNQILKTYKISLSKQASGKKRVEGDAKTPEGIYTINDKNRNSKFYLNLGISYPNAQDRKYAKSIGESPGGAIKIHGIRNGYGWIGKFHRFVDWTNGCIALTNSEIEELYNSVSIGTSIEIKP
ncbi:L,D-transpeptidase family protein [bacterium]|nr:L,D-transpeptidase family protein [bacterium]